MKNIKLLAIFAVLLAATTHAWAWSGSGTTDTPWLISSEDDWNELATQVNGGESYYGKYFQLTEDISVTTMVGVPNLGDYTLMGVYGPAFCGTFDGGGHTITVDYEVCESDNPYYVEDWAAAPFRVVGHGAVLSNVNTKGKISGCIGFAAGLIGCIKDVAKGTINVTIEHCRSSVEIDVYNILVDGDDPYARASTGGIIGSTTGWYWAEYTWGNTSNVNETIKIFGEKTIRLRDCVFDGSLRGGDYDTGLGGLVGSTAWNVDLWFDGCVFAPSYISLDHMETQSTFVHLLREKDDNMVHFEHCYYVNNPDFIGNMLDGMNMQGTQVYSIRGKSGVTADFSGYGLIPLYNDFKLVKFYKDASGFKGFKMDNALYAKGTETLSLHLEGSNADYKVSSPATLTGCDNPYTLQMNNANCEISPAPLTITSKSSELSDCPGGASKSIAFSNPNNYLIKWVLKRGDDEVGKTTDYAEVASPIDISSYLTEAGTYTFAISAKLSNGCEKENIDKVSFEVYAMPAAEITTTPAELNSCLNGESKQIALSTYDEQIKWVLKRDGVKLNAEENYASYTGPIEIPAEYLTKTGNYTFTISARTVNGCTTENIDEVAFAVYAVPAVEITSTAADLNSCLNGGNVYVALSNNADSVKWVLKRNGAEVHTEDYKIYDGQIEISAASYLTEAGSYTFTISAKTVNGCEKENISSVSFEVYAAPAVAITTTPAELDSCLNGEDKSIALSTYLEQIKWELKRGSTVVHTEDYAGYTGPIGISAAYLNQAGDYTFTISAMTANGCEKEDISSVAFAIYPIPTVTFDVVAPIKSGTLTHDVTLKSLTDATKYDYWVENALGDRISSVGKATDVPASQMTITLTTGGLGEGTYTLYVLPKSATCEGQPTAVDFVVNDEPTISFGSEEIVVCSSEEVKIPFATSDDAITITYSIVGDGGPEITVGANSSPLILGIKPAGTYTVKAFASTYSINGSAYTKTLTVLAPLTENHVSKPKEYIGCGDTYSDTIIVNLHPTTAGRKICAKYTDEGEHIAYAETKAGDATATLILTGLKHTDLVGDHPVKVYVDGFEDCGIDVGYTEPKLMKITENFDVTPLPMKCGEETFTLTGTIEANCNEGTIIVKYNDSHITSVSLSTSNEFTLANIPIGGSITQLKAYYEGKSSCAVMSKAFTEPRKPQASITATPPAMSCYQETFDLSFTLDYTYQQAGTLTVSLDGFPDKTYESSNGDYAALASDEKTLSGTFSGLPADGRNGVKLKFAFSGDHSCADSISLVFPRTPLITSEIEEGNIDMFVSGDTYSPTFTVSYDHTDGETLVLEYQKANGEWVSVISSPVSGNGSYTFKGLTFDDVAMGERTVYVYFHGSTCDKKEHTYIAPSTTPIVPHVTISDIQEPVISEEYCDADDYTVTVTLNVTNARGNINATCKGVSVEQPAEEGENTIVITGVPRDGRPSTIDISFTGTGGATSDRQTVEYTQHPKPELISLTINAPSEISCDADSYKLVDTIRCANLGTAAITMWMEDDEGTKVPQDGAITTNNETAALVFTSAIYVPADDKPYTLHVQATGDNWHDGCNLLTAAIPAVSRPDATSISLKTIEPLCDSEKELVLPFALIQGDISEATLTLTGSNIFNAAMDINATKDTLTYALPDRLTAGKHTAFVEARNASGCVTTAELPIEVAQDSLIYSKWTEVLIVDNHAGLYTGYQWYQNGQPIGNEPVLHVPGGMSGNTYYCRLTLRDGSQIVTCEHAFDDIQRSADHQQEAMANTIAVQPKRVAAGGTVTVQQTAEETLHLFLTTATGKRVAEYTQTQSSSQIEMPALQGVYLLRIVSGSDMQTVKIVVY